MSINTDNGWQRSYDSGYFVTINCDNTGNTWPGIGSLADVAYHNGCSVADRLQEEWHADAVDERYDRVVLAADDEELRDISNIPF